MPADTKARLTELDFARQHLERAVALSPELVSARLARLVGKDNAAELWCLLRDVDTSGGGGGGGGVLERICQDAVSVVDVQSLAPLLFEPVDRGDGGVPSLADLDVCAPVAERERRVTELTEQQQRQRRHFHTRLQVKAIAGHGQEVDIAKSAEGQKPLNLFSETVVPPPVQFQSTTTAQCLPPALLRERRF